MYRRIICMMMMAIGVISAQAQEDWGNYRRFEKDNQVVKTLPQDQRKVVFMGNSITEGWINQHPDFFKKNGYVNRGISGQTSYQMLLRFHEDVVNLHPKAVVINAGTNDIAQNNHFYVEDRTFENIVAMVEIAQANKIKVILTTITPCDHYGWRPEITNVIEKIQHLNGRICDYAKTHKCLFVDYFSAMADERGAMRKGLAADGEGCHPLSEGYDVMEPLVTAAIQKAVK